MLRPFDPNNSELMKLDRIVSDSGTGVLYLLTFAVVYAVFLLLHGATALPKYVARGTSHLVHDWHHSH